MSIAIKDTNSKGLRVINCKFQGFETDIELNNVEDFISQGNAFSKDDPSYLLKELANSIWASSLSPDYKKKLFQDVIAFLSTGASDNTLKRGLGDKITHYVGQKAVDYFIQLAAAVSAGLVLKSLK